MGKIRDILAAIDEIKSESSADMFPKVSDEEYKRAEELYRQALAQQGIDGDGDYEANKVLNEIIDSTISVMNGISEDIRAIVRITGESISSKDWDGVRKVLGLCSGILEDINGFLDLAKEIKNMSF